jgi:hypothetical protein
MTTERRRWPDDYETPVLEERGLRCPKCNCPHLWVVYTRKCERGRIRRRRECRNCQHRITTYEGTP